MLGIINVFNTLLSAAWKGSSQNQIPKSKLIEGLISAPSSNQVKIEGYINEYKNVTLASSNQTQSSDIDKKVYEVVVFPLTNLIGAAYKLGISIYKFFPLDWGYSEKTRILQIESIKNNSSSSNLDQNQVANLLKNSTIYRNLTKVEDYKRQYENMSKSTRADNSSGGVVDLNQTHFEEFFKNSTEKTNSEVLLSNDFYKAAGCIAALILVSAPVLYLVHKNIRKAHRGDDLKNNGTRRNSSLKKFKTLSKKALIHDRFEKIQKENTKIKESKQVSKLLESQGSASKINIEKPDSLEKSKVKILKPKPSRSSNQFLRAFSDLKKLFDPNSEPLSLRRIYKFIVL